MSLVFWFRAFEWLPIGSPWRSRILLFVDVSVFNGFVCFPMMFVLFSVPTRFFKLGREISRFFLIRCDSVMFAKCCSSHLKKKKTLWKTRNRWIRLQIILCTVARFVCGIHDKHINTQKTQNQRNHFYEFMSSYSNDQENEYAISQVNLFRAWTAREQHRAAPENKQNGQLIRAGNNIEFQENSPRGSHQEISPR